MIDTHTHLYSTEFDEDRVEMIQRALNKGVERFYLPAIDSETHENMLKLESDYPNQIFSMMGLHPCSVKPESWENELKLVKDYLEKRHFVAIGEIGIDLYWDQSTLDIQVKAFEQQIDWAIKMDLPIVIHTRSSFDEVFEVLDRKKHPKLRGIFHCFSGNLNQAKRAIDLGFILGIGGVVTFKNADSLRETVKKVPLDRIHVETDAPFLAPVPKRGKKNTPAFVLHTAQFVSELKGVSLETLCEQTKLNALKMFPKIQW